MRHLWNDSVTIIKQSEYGAVNDLGQRARGTREIKATGFFTYRRGEHTAEVSFDGNAVLFLPEGTDIADMDLVVFEGLTWTVAGPPITYRSAFKGARFMEARLERSDGK